MRLGAAVLVGALVLAVVLLVVLPAGADEDPPGPNDAVCAWGDGRQRRVETIFRFIDAGGFLQFKGAGEPGTTLGSAQVSSLSESVAIAPDGQSATVQQWLWIDEDPDDWLPGFPAFCTARAHR